MMIEDNKKYRIAELERQKISIEDELQFTTNQLTKMFEPSKERLIRNARTSMLNAQDPWFKAYWEKVLQHLLKAYKRLD